MAQTLGDIFNIVNPIMSKYGIPIYIWKPIMMQESGGNPNSKAITSKEYSVGLFQINKMAHPQYNSFDLTNPAVNAEIAARDFISGGYATAKKITSDKVEQGLITYSGLKNPDVVKSKYSGSDFIAGGIKPKWTTALLHNMKAAFTTSLGQEAKLRAALQDADQQKIITKEDVFKFFWTGEKPGTVSTATINEAGSAAAAIAGKEYTPAEEKIEGVRGWLLIGMQLAIVIVMIIAAFNFLHITPAKALDMIPAAKAAKTIKKESGK